MGWVFEVQLSGENISEIECLRVVAMATNFGNKIAINWLCVNDIAPRQLAMEGDLSGRPTECRYCGYPAHKGRCHDNHFWLSMSYNFGCMIASVALANSRGGFSGSRYPMKT